MRIRQRAKENKIEGIEELAELHNSDNLEYAVSTLSLVSAEMGKI